MSGSVVAVCIVIWVERAMVATWTKAAGKRNVMTQIVVAHRQVGVQGPDCRKCNLSLAMANCRDYIYVLCKQVNDLLSLVTELNEEAERLRSIREYEREIDWWSQTLPFLQQSQPAQNAKDAKGFPSFFYLAAWAYFMEEIILIC